MVVRVKLEVLWNEMYRYNRKTVPVLYLTF